MVTLRCDIFPADLDATAAFYTEVLGFTLDRDERSEGYLALHRDTVRLGARQNPPAPRELRDAFNVVRTRILQQTRTKGLNTIMVTSPGRS